MRRIFLLLILFLFSSTSLQAQKRAFTIEDLYRVKNISDLHLSPDGQTIIFTVTTSDLPRARRNSHIWALDIGGNVNGQNPRQLTTSEKSESSPLFSPDGRQISFISSKDGSADLYLMPAGGGEWRKLTNISTGVSDPLWSADGKWILSRWMPPDRAGGLLLVAPDGSGHRLVVPEAQACPDRDQGCDMSWGQPKP